jgi:hypothetical protein
MNMKLVFQPYQVGWFPEFNLFPAMAAFHGVLL